MGTRTGFKVKDPDEVLDFLWDWADRLLTNEVIQTSSFFVTPPGLTQDSETSDNTTATVWFSGGTMGVDYRVTNRVETDQGRTYDWTQVIRVRPR